MKIDYEKIWDTPILENEVFLEALKSNDAYKIRLATLACDKRMLQFYYELESETDDPLIKEIGFEAYAAQNLTLWVENNYGFEFEEAESLVNELLDAFLDATA